MSQNTLSYVARAGASELKRRSGLRATLPTVVQSTRLGTSRSEELIFTHGVPKGPF